MVLGCLEVKDQRRFAFFELGTRLHRAEGKVKRISELTFVQNTRTLPCKVSRFRKCSSVVDY